MSGELGQQFKEAMFQILTEDQALTALIGGRVYTFVPDQRVYPYLRISNLIGADGGTKSSPGQMLTWVVDIFDREKSDVILDKIKKRLYDLIHEQKPSVEGGSVGVCRFHSSFIQPLSDAITRHSVMRFRLNLYGDQAS